MEVDNGEISFAKNHLTMPHFCDKVEQVYVK